MPEMPEIYNARWPIPADACSCGGCWEYRQNHPGYDQLNHPVSLHTFPDPAYLPPWLTEEELQQEREQANERELREYNARERAEDDARRQTAWDSAGRPSDDPIRERADELLAADAMAREARERRPICSFCGWRYDPGGECQTCEPCDVCGELPGECVRCSDCDSHDCTCNDYYADDSPRLHAYSYKPRFAFHGDGPTFYGMEIEVTSDNSDAQLSIAECELGDLGYLVEDGSVRGFEAVTQPMSYEFFMSNFPWGMLPSLENAGCDIEPDNNGIHVHVSRDGFTDRSHLHRWMKFFYRNKAHVADIARRDSYEWGAFREDFRRGIGAHTKVKGNVPRGRRPCGECFYCSAGRHACEEYVRAYGWSTAEARSQGYLGCTGDPGVQRDPTLSTRYSAINTTNEKTLEVRVFASTLDIAEAQQALQLVAASVEYTRGLTANAVVRRGGWAWARFRDYLGESDRYRALAEATGAVAMADDGFTPRAPNLWDLSRAESDARELARANA